MASLLTHPIVPMALGLGLGRKVIPRPLLVLGCLGSLLPDLDVLAFRMGIPYAHPLGHRGFTHSLLVAALAGLASMILLRRHSPPARAFLFTFLATASHGVLDAFTTGGLGVAFLWPWSPARFFAPVRGIRVSPIGLSRFLGPQGLAVLQSEVRWVWAPSAALGLGLATLRRPRPEAGT